ncbi:general substrate transporter [Aspergillus ruber CBS 135680]|uniref:General substrate transporter n=1 Tax=Aspergillus ruber (strain CBS 135680) TaxID=1388766 RepID=A0A017SC85_ASPRC|nr:general substrate transporter [Aspergillus ruber CBS 135680]EYE94406.1 general substrate transporter [Aspergillus ruber CBS 135680]
MNFERRSIILIWGSEQKLCSCSLRGTSLTLAQLILVVCPAFLLFGYNQTNVAGLATLPDWVERFPRIDTSTTHGAQRSDNATIQGVVLEASAFQLAQLIVGRTILGMGHVVLDGVLISLGYVLQAWINLSFYQFKPGPITWRPAVAIPIFFSLNRVQAAYTTLAALKDDTENSTQIHWEITAMQVSLEETRHTTASLLDLLRMGEDRLLYRFGLCILLQFYQQMSGGNLISVYSTTIFESGLRMDSETARILSGGTLTWKLLTCFIGFFAIDRFGRRFVLIISGTGMATCMMGSAIATSFPTSNYGARVVSVLFVFLFNFFIPIGFLGVNFLCCTEVSPTRLRVAMSSIPTANHWLWNFAVTMITPVAIDTIGYRYYIVYTCVGFCIPKSVYFLYPEIAGRSLEDIDRMFRDSPSVLSCVKYMKGVDQSVIDDVEGKRMVKHRESM